MYKKRGSLGLFCRTFSINLRFHGCMLYIRREKDMMDMKNYTREETYGIAKLLVTTGGGVLSFPQTLDISFQNLHSW